MPKQKKKKKRRKIKCNCPVNVEDGGSDALALLLFKRIGQFARNIVYFSYFHRKEKKRKENMLADLSNISAESRVKSYRGVFLKVGPVMVNVV